MDTRKLITVTAIRLFKECGYENVSIPMICKDAKVSKGTFYYHFQSKKEIIYEHIEDFMTGYTDILPDMLALSSPKEQLWKLYEFSFQNIISMNPNLLRAFYTIDIEDGLKQFSPSKGYTFGYHTNTFMKLTKSLVEKAQKCGEITKKVSSENLILCYSSVIIGTGLDWACQNGSFNEIERLKILFDIVFC